MGIFEKISSGIYCIAEMSANHAGDLENALEIVHAAKRSGADCVKIQTYTADSMTIDCDNENFVIKGGLWDNRTLYELYKEASMPYEWQNAIKTECDSVGIDFLSTPFDKEGVDFLEGLQVEAYKVASFELVDLPLIEHIAKKGKPMIVSCGMASIEEIEEALQTIESAGLPRTRVVLLKCTSEYPSRIEDMNLLTIADMIKRFEVTVGLSDHSLGSLAPIVAVALGAQVIEKHFCLSRTVDNPDSEFSSEPHEFFEMTKSVRQTRDACGEVSYEPAAEERGSLLFRRSVFAVKDIAEDEVFTSENIRIIRPGQGLPPKEYARLLGTRSTRCYKRGTPILPD